MRRMRPIWQYFLFAVPVVVVAFGMQYLSKHRGSRNLASVHDNGSALAQLQQKLERKFQHMEADEDTPTQNLRVAKSSGASLAVPGAEPQPFDAAKPGECVSLEIPAQGPDSTTITKMQWEQVMGEFHDAKDLLSAWLSDHKSGFSPKTYQWMRTQVADARLQRPAVPPVLDEEPDLSWRGIGVLAGVRDGAPLIRVGSGFVKLVRKYPQRARFELARLLAQTWSPCEISKVDRAAGGVGPWHGFLSCMQMTADAAKECGTNSVSETGWAVSSALATVASPPGCKIPAFDRAPASQCLGMAGAKGVHL